MVKEIKNSSIAKNTIMLYIRQILILFVSLYTVRVVLNVLGPEDYGIYSVVGGVVLLFVFLKGTMASATQRFFSFEIGRNDSVKLKQTFSVNLVVYISIGVIAFLLLETIGLWYVSEKLKIPSYRFDSAILLFHYSIFTFIMSVLNTPFMAIIIAHEDMKIYAYISIIEVLMKLGVVVLLMYLPWDKLELYGLLLCVVAIINFSIYLSVCIKKYEECQFKKFYWDLGLFKNLINFTGWTLFGQLSTVFRRQGIIILLNQTFNPIVVAAMAIATNITTQVGLFSANFNMSLYPPIIKAYAAEKKEEMFTLIFKGSRFTFFLIWVFALPLFLTMDTILMLWLKEVPEQTVLFCRLSLVEVLIMAIGYPLTTAARAPGKMKIYELVLGTIQILIFFVSWILFKSGFDAYYTLLVAILANILMFIIRLIILKYLIELQIGKYLKQVMVPVIGVMLCSLIPLLPFFKLFIEDKLILKFLLVVLSVLFSSVSMYFIGMDKHMRNKVRNIVSDKIIIIRKVFKK
ncbi:lipopolysaccharide biosynthesis protein [Seonamhaeicola aphaedonensis]|nr:oligosaccharide flippase family protein [Seonamhaeicola aphaedonensis]